MKKLCEILRTNQCERLFSVTLLLAAMHFFAWECRSEESPLPSPSLSKPPASPAPAAQSSAPTALPSQPSNKPLGPYNLKPTNKPAVPATPTPNQPGEVTPPGQISQPGQAIQPGQNNQAGQAGGGAAQFGGFQGSSSPAAVSQSSFAPNMIGDFFSGAASTIDNLTVPTHVTLPGLIIADSSYNTGGLTIPTAGTNIGATHPSSGIGFVVPQNGPDPFFVAYTGSLIVGNTFGLTNVQPYITGDLTTRIMCTPALQIYTPSGIEPVATVTDLKTSAPGTLGHATLDYYYNRPISLTVPPPGVNVGTMKIAENTSPLPRDRVYFNYSYFDGVPLTANGVNVNRFTPGFEKTFFNQWASIEVRTPFAQSLSNTIIADGITNTSATQFGDVTTYYKQLFYKSQTMAISGGLGFSVPTANNVNVYNALGQQLIAIKNQSVHALPFMGALYTPNDRYFSQQFLQFDYDTNGNAVYVADSNGTLQSVGRATETNYLYYSIGSGYWLYNNPNSDRLFTRFAPTVEMHYNKSLGFNNGVSSNGYNVGTNTTITDLLNGTIGMTAMMGPNKTITAAYVTPLSGISDRQFNGEFRLMVNWFFGGSTNRFSRVQF